MTEIAQAMMTATTENQQLSELPNARLQLTGDDPQPVYVTMIDDNTPAFASQEGGPYFSGGIQWQMGDEPMFVFFVLLGGVTRVDCLALLYSDVFSPTWAAPNNVQIMTIPAAPATYPFTVSIGTSKFDPQIVVTPIEPYSCTNGKA